jgi:hypothetical protein
MLHVRPELVWDHEIPADPEADEGFVVFYVGRVLDRGTAEDVRALGLERIRKFLDVAPARREVIDFWRWWLERRERKNGNPHTGTEAPAPNRGANRADPI